MLKSKYFSYYFYNIVFIVASPWSVSKRLTMEKSHVKTIISQSGRHIVSELNKEIEKLGRRISELIEANYELSEIYRIVTSMLGMGFQNAVCLMVYTYNFRRFNYDARKIACYYGIAPFGKVSCTSINTDPHVHYMSNRQIKAMLMQAALAAIRYNKTISKYYSGLVEEGKKNQVALNNVKNKLIHLVTSMARNHKLYNPEYRMST